MAGLAALALGYVLSQLYRSFLAVLTPALTVELGATKADLSLASGAWFIAFALIALAFGIDIPPSGLIMILPALILTGLMVGALGLLLASLIRQLENFAGVMNFVIFPMFFLSTALYPVWKMQEASAVLAAICEWNPFSHGIELIRFALYGQMNWLALAMTVGSGLVFFLAAAWAFDPSRRFRAGRTA